MRYQDSGSYCLLRGLARQRACFPSSVRDGALSGRLASSRAQTTKPKWLRNIIIRNNSYVGVRSG
eukprot:7751540-Heterocapsa_arctica.AAC.1